MKYTTVFHLVGRTMRLMFGTALVIALAAGVGPVTPAAAATPVYVVPGPLCDGNASCFTTIQAGIDAVFSGGTVNVAAGTYNENILITKALTLQGAGRDQTTILGTGDTGRFTVRIQNANGVTIDGVRVTNPHITAPTWAVGILIDGSQNVSIRNSLVDFIGTDRLDAGDGAWGIDVMGGNDIEIAYNEIANITAMTESFGEDGSGLAGIVVWAPQNKVAENVFIHDNQISHIRALDTGVWDRGIEPTVNSRNVTTDHNTIDDTLYGIFISGTTIPPQIVTNNTVTNAAVQGIHLGAREQTVTGNTVSGSWIGIGMAEFNPTANGTISENIITGNTTGVYIADTTGLGAVLNSNSIAGNTIGVSNDGTAVFDASGNWWGCSGGPGAAGCDSVSANVDFTPWLCDGTDTEPDVIGFQPDPTNLCGIATKLVFSTQPGNGVAGLPLTTQPLVRAEDEDGNLVTDFSGPVTLAIGTNPGGGTLSGTNPVNAVNGVAAFSGLSINNAGMGYTLVASATLPGGPASVTSNPFIITSACVTGGIQQPINADGSSNFMLGRTIPVKIRVTCGGVPDNTLGPQIALVKVDIPTGPVNEIISSSAADTGTTMRSAGDGQYLFNLSTKRSQFNAGQDLTAGGYRLTITSPAFAPVVVQFDLRP